MFSIGQTYKSWGDNNTYTVMGYETENHILTVNIIMRVNRPSDGLGWYETKPKFYWTKWLLFNETIIRKILKLEGEEHVTIFEK